MVSSSTGRISSGEQRLYRGSSSWQDNSSSVRVENSSNRQQFEKERSSQVGRSSTGWQQYKLAAAVQLAAAAQEEQYSSAVQGGSAEMEWSRDQRLSFASLHLARIISEESSELTELFF